MAIEILKESQKWNEWNIGTKISRKTTNYESFEFIDIPEWNISYWYLSTFLPQSDRHLVPPIQIEPYKTILGQTRISRKDVIGSKTEYFL